MTTETAFARWLKALGLSIRAGGEELGLSKSRAMEFATGRSRNKARGTPKLDKRTRLAMAAIAKKVKPWPKD